MKSHIAIIIAVFIVLASATYYFFGRKIEDTTQQQIENSNTSAMEEELAHSASTLRELFEKGEPLTCAFEREDENGSVDGRVYIDDERVRADFTIAMQEQGSYEAHMIRDGEWIHTWGGPYEANTGMKLMINKEQTAEGSVDQDVFDVDQEVDYVCKSWNVDEALFKPPSTITFTELNVGAMMGGTAAQGGAGMDIDCSMCDQAPGAEAQAQCRTALGC